MKLFYILWQFNCFFGLFLVITQSQHNLPKHYSAPENLLYNFKLQYCAKVARLKSLYSASTMLMSGL